LTGRKGDLTFDAPLVYVLSYPERIQLAFERFLRRKDRLGKIIIVDDMPSVGLLFQRYLKSAGFQDIVRLQSAEELFEALELDDEDATCADVDIILTDLIMPGINGLEACRRIKADHKYQDIPILVVSAAEEVGRVKEALEAGALDYIRKPVERVELVARVSAALKLKHEMTLRRQREQELEEANRSLQEANAMLKMMAIIDSLTGIPNRRYLDESLATEWNRCRREQSRISLAMVDIDHFKLYNDHYGHKQGDECLKIVGQTLKKCVKRPADFVARYGGEEFAVVLPNTDLEGGFLVAEDTRREIQLLELPHETSPTSSVVTISVGICSLNPMHHEHYNELIVMADQALYEAKNTGRNQVAKANPSQKESSNGQ
jgi:diguanylate cyclase (GGDEF)-like protein